MHQLRVSLRDAWRLAVPYWRSKDWRRAAALLGALVLLNLLLVGTNILFTFWQGAFYNALEGRDWKGFLGSLLWFTKGKEGFAIGFAPVLIIFVLTTAYELYLRQALQIEWRRWLTTQLMDDWLRDRTYFRMTLLGFGADNPDQRIAEDVRLYVENALLLGLGFVRAIASLFSFVFILWTMSRSVAVFGHRVPGSLVWIAVVYAGAGTWLTHRVGRRLIPLHYSQQKVEADFRFSLMRFTENAEQIAFQGGESEQEREFLHRFGALVENWRGIMTATLHLTFLTSSYAQIVLIFPLLIVAPAYFAGLMSLGGIFQTSNAFAQVQTSLSWIVQSYADLTSWFATVQRLSGFQTAVSESGSAGQGVVVTQDDGQDLRLVELTLTLPDGRLLLSGVNLRLSPGGAVLINGVSGAGKSTLMRAMAGIWPFGRGHVCRPKASSLFLPQRPYMPLGSLKRAICYPASEEQFGDQEVAVVLHEVGLSHLANALSETDVWERRLSGGEQRRLAFGRALLVRPHWLFLDEATTGLDEEAEVHLYTLLAKHLPDTTTVSIAHSARVAAFHDSAFTIESGGVRETNPPSGRAELNSRLD